MLSEWTYWLHSDDELALRHGRIHSSRTDRSTGFMAGH